MNDLLNCLPEEYERLRRVRDSEHDPAYLDRLVAHWQDPDNVPLPADPEAEGWESVCITAGLMAWVDDIGINGKVGTTLVLTERGKAALHLWEQSQQVLPPNGAKLTPDKVPPQFKRDEDPNGDLLTAKYIVNWSDLELTNTDLSRYFGPGKPLTRRVRVGKGWVYLYRELKALSKAKTARMT